MKVTKFATRVNFSLKLLEVLLGHWKNYGWDCDEDTLILDIEDVFFEYRHVWDRPKTKKPAES